MIINISTQLYSAESNINENQDHDYDLTSLTEQDQSKISSLNQELIRAAQISDHKTMETIMHQGADINYQDELGNTAAHYLYADGNHPNGKAILILAIYQAKMDVLNNNGESAELFINKRAQKVIAPFMPTIIPLLEALIPVETLRLVADNVEKRNKEMIAHYNTHHEKEDK